MLMLTAETRIPIPRNCLSHISGVHKLMNKFVTTAVGFLAVGSINAADPSDYDWLGLDNEIKSISSSIAENDDGIGMAALLRFNYAYATDEVSTGLAPSYGEDISGFRFDDIDLAFWTNIGDYIMRVSLDLAGTTGNNSSGVELQDAYAAWSCPEDLNIMAGRMNPTSLHDGNVAPEDLFFMDRTAMGAALYHYDEGIQVGGDVQDIGWSFGVFNGGGFTHGPEESDHTFFLRGQYDLGEGDGGHEGSHEKAAGTNLTAGLGISVDNTQSGDTMNVGLDVHGNHDRIGFDFTYLMIDDDITANTGTDTGVLFNGLSFDGDSSPYALAVTYSINPDWSVGIRHEDMDNTAGNELLTVGCNFYGAGQGARWSANYTDVSSDGANPDGSYFQIGYVLGFSE